MVAMSRPGEVADRLEAYWQEVAPET
jgi:hypothetical protein